MPTDRDRSAARLLHAGVSTALLSRPTPASVPRVVRLPDALTQQVCGTLSEARQGVERVLDGLLKLATRDRVEGGVFMSLAVEVASDRCRQWFPAAVDALRNFSGS
jgi:hypothetical protein